jgi:aminoglycoside N3'-acetyltransferase
MSEIYTQNQLSLCLSDLGILDGDCIFIHTSLKGVGKLEIPDPRRTMHVLLDSFLAAVGPTGTLVAPTFNFGFCQGKPFDRQHTPSVAMGAFSEHIRTEPHAVRSKHPFQCVSAIGSHANRIADAEGKSAFAKGSSFDEMLALDSKIIFFGIDFVETFVHISEERAQVPYRFWKTFTGPYIDQGHQRERSVEFFARKLDMVPEPFLDKPKINRFLRAKGIIKGHSLGIGQVSVCRAVEFVDTMTAALNENPFGYLVGYEA